MISNVLQSSVSCIIIQDSRLRAIGALVTNTLWTVAAETGFPPLTSIGVYN